jgi:DNA polymerase
MKPISADDLQPDEMAALMHFYAEAGVAWLSEDAPVDRFAELAASQPRPSAGDLAAPAASREAAAERSRRPAPPVAPSSAPVAIPDSEAVEQARRLAAEADSVAALVDAVAAFGGCNLRFSARHTVFADGDPASRIVVVGGVPAAEDDREGRPFSGAAGRMLERMLYGAGLATSACLAANIVPWRTPGDRAPTVREVEICAPFSIRLIELVRPEAVLVLGNLAARILAAAPRAGIHALRGRWFDIAAGSGTARGFATFHPEELLTTPISKRLAWQDMLRFGAEITMPGPAGDL